MPADFHELPAEQIDLGIYFRVNAYSWRPPKPLDNAINVHLETPLEMVIYLDDLSESLWSSCFLSKYQDDAQRLREEAMIQNGCSIDIIRINFGIMRAYSRGQIAQR